MKPLRALPVALTIAVTMVATMARPAGRSCSAAWTSFSFLRQAGVPVTRRTCDQSRDVDVDVSVSVSVDGDGDGDVAVNDGRVLGRRTQLLRA